MRAPVRRKSRAGVKWRRWGIDLPGSARSDRITVPRISRLGGRDILVRANFPSGNGGEGMSTMACRGGESDPAILGRWKAGSRGPAFAATASEASVPRRRIGEELASPRGRGRGSPLIGRSAAGPP